MKALNDYTGRCGSCKYYKASYKDGRITKMGKCHKRMKLSKHRASDKGCLEYEEEGAE